MSVSGSLCFCSACGNLLDRVRPNVTSITCTICQTPNENNWPKTQTVMIQQSALPSSSLRKKKHSFVKSGDGKEGAGEALMQEACPKCEHPEMYYSEVQMRSADEGSTIRYRCPKCGHKFNANN
ncbi:Rpa12 DNA-directed RNA polymerase I [Myriangium duriaei CBS 260.36]|uniref:DNA-directed RNA polymerase subunit n=1 Tax=Myriangium duriaei CBS 260.36 TaxID=1168546 RepID=A0A9P4IQ70_9PEZI|nr:Rpa12 DNA-directed RNA polymerase I [Myriangium duriaei CBS 260.36]